MREHKAMNINVAVDDGRSERVVPRAPVVRNNFN